MSVFRSGNGGYISVGSGPIRLDIKQWSGNFGARLVENTHSGTGGADNYEKVCDSATWSCDVPLDESNLPDVDVGLVPGAKVTIKFMIGAGAKFYKLTNTTVESAEPTNDNTSDIVRIKLSGKGGTITRPVTG